MSKTALFGKKEPYVSTTNACTLCKPLGACIAFRGVEGGIPFLHGSQGCATYMRRYVISHYREPMDIASSSLGEKHAIYGGGPNLKLGLKNVISKYKTKLIGVATTCLTETIGDDVKRLVAEFKKEFSQFLIEHGSPEIVTVSTPSYSGCHIEGFHAAVKAIVDHLSTAETTHNGINILPGYISPADTRALKEIVSEFSLNSSILPDLSISLDGPASEQYEKIPPGGTPVPEIRNMGGAASTIEFGFTQMSSQSPGELLQARFGVPLKRTRLPIGIRETDNLMDSLEGLSGKSMSSKQVLTRGQLVDAYIDGHKYVFGKRIIVYGSQDLVVGLTSFLVETGMFPVLCASGEKTGKFQKEITEVTRGFTRNPPLVVEGIDFHQIEELMDELNPDLLLGNSKGYYLARKLKIPLIRVGFPIHDRFGGQRERMLGYEGTQIILDRIINRMIEYKQENSDIGYSYI